MRLDHILTGWSILLMTACVMRPQDIVPKPTDLTIVNAISQIRQAVVKAQQEAITSGQSSGLYPCTAQAILNVTADAHNSNTLVLDASIKPPQPVAPSLSVTNTYGVNANASVGNQIIITLASEPCIYIAAKAAMGPGTETGANTAKTGTGTGAGPANSPNTATGRGMGTGATAAGNPRARAKAGTAANAAVIPGMANMEGPNPASAGPPPGPTTLPTFPPPPTLPGDPLGGAGDLE